MVRRPEEQEVISDSLLRKALLEVRREVLLPQAYVRRDAGYPEPVVLELLDGAHPDDRREWLELIYSGASVLAQRDGEALEGQVRGRMRGGRITSAAFWLALAHLVPGLVRDFSAERLTLIAPKEDSWAIVGPDGDVEEVGQRPVWDKVCEVYARWERAGRPERYRLEFVSDGRQYITAGAGTAELAWELPTLAGSINEIEGERGE
ncbi:hypothetical protein K6I33_001953 [Streptomyces sp. UNOB3_S3]|nr:hypothetical protein [Streptomyces sp. UNOB3_S3]